jgi:hypothetical protein
LVLDFDGGVAGCVGKDLKGRSITATLDGGVELVIGSSSQGRGLRLEIVGEIDVVHQGNLHWHTTGDWTTECTTWRHITKTDYVHTAQKILNKALARTTNEAPDIVNNNGLYTSEL